MSKTFEEVCSKCCRGCNSHEKDRCGEVWNASEKATEKRVIDDVINRFEKCRNMVDFNYALNEYIRDFGVSYE